MWRERLNLNTKTKVFCPYIYNKKSTAAKKSDEQKQTVVRWYCGVHYVDKSIDCPTKLLYRWLQFSNSLFPFSAAWSRYESALRCSLFGWSIFTLWTCCCVQCYQVEGSFVNRSQGETCANTYTTVTLLLSCNMLQVSNKSNQMPILALSITVL